MRYVYVIRNLVNGKVYIGQSIDPKIRWRGHINCALRGKIQRPLYSSIRLHGAENFSFEVIEECDDVVINEREQFWVAHFDSFNPEKGYNLTLGGENNPMQNPVTRAKVSKSKTGKPGWAKGIPKSEEQRRKMSQAKMGIPLSEEHRSKVGKPKSEEQRRLISQKTREAMQRKKNQSG